ncbi:hypothetical protein EK21DRAFT_111961 [Setomelanomma holmii]|uniref:Uncharacterized protein n=1 Tax=Setomelanomma holmii TaxID=210430 RepID=A0A9P4LN83_9PLEO|nr:hypothetical protein EK21DRAFT_111961 [Setomelanomma holmii]
MSEHKVSITSSKKAPFTRPSTVSTNIESAYPTSFRDETTLLDPRDAPLLFLKHDLLTPKLAAIHDRLWLSGMTRQARPLHRQKLLQRTIHITESANEHLVWHRDNILFKLMPGYLLDSAYWETHVCPDEQLFASGTGQLLSYVWLVASVTDYAIAIEQGIYPTSVTWAAWQTIVRDILLNIDTVLAHIDRRYHYGELRLSRLNTLYRFNTSTFSLRNLVYGFMPMPTWYAQFFERNFGWILAAFIYITVVLSAMQVGLATSRLQNHVQFQEASYGTAVTVTAMVVAAIVLMLAVWVVLFWFHLGSTIRYLKREMVKRRKTQENNE